MTSSTTNAQDFLNLLKPAEVKVLLKAMQRRGGFSDLINPRHVSSSLNLDQLKNMKSIRPQDGAILFKLMQCKVKKHHLDHPPQQHHAVALRLDGIRWPKSIQQRYNKFSVLKSIDHLNIYSHHITLRYILGKKHLSTLGSGQNSLQGSHLCDTKGCVSEEHLCIETKEVNNNRRTCQGIIVHIYEDTTGEYIIFQIDPCRHGVQHEGANGDFLKYSCRKIRAVFIKKNDLR